MRFRLTSLLALTLAAPAFAQNSAPQPAPYAGTIPAARDVPYPGTMTLDVDATDIERAIFRVRQTIPVAQAGPMTLLFPEWLQGNHAPRGQIEKLAGLKISAGGKPIAWRRDPVEVFAFHVDVPAGAKRLDLAFQFVSATASDQGRVVVTPSMMNIQPNSVSLYPAGYFTRRIPVTMSVKYPEGWQAATALKGERSGSTVRYETVDYDTLVDSPIFAGKHFRREQLAPNVHLAIVADEAKNLVARPDQIEAHRRLVDQAFKLFGSRPFDRYEFLLALTDEMGGIGLEHHRSSENGVNPEYFTEWDKGPGRRNLLPHELTHSWNGKHRRPAGIWAPDFRTPTRNNLLWVYEGQTQFWGYVLGARSGLFSKQETLDAIASIAAGLDDRAGREWRHLEDTAFDPILSARRPKPWTSWQRSEDYYNEGMMIWLEADAVIREASGGAKSMDDFARAFFAANDGDYGVVTYELEDVARTLNGVTPYDWQGFLTRRIGENADAAPKAGLERGGYRLIYTEEPTAYWKNSETMGKTISLAHSIGISVKAGEVTAVIWDSPAFDAGIAVGQSIVAVNGRAFSDDGIKEAITAAKSARTPIRLLVKAGDRYRDVALDYHGGLRYPRLEKIGAGEGGLDRLLAPRR